MSVLKFPPILRRDRTIRNVNDLVDEQRTFGERWADRVAAAIGSWRFILIQSLLLILWVVMNVVGWVKAWDPYPFILMNLVLSTQAAFTAPIIMMSQKRQSDVDRIEAHNDYVVNQKAGQEIDLILTQIEAQNRALLVIHESLEAIKTRIESLEPPSNNATT